MQLGYTLLYVDDVQKTVAFYEAAFGLKRKLVHENGYAEMDTGATTLGFVAHSVIDAAGIDYRKSSPEGPAPPVEIALVTDDVAAAYARAVEAGAAAVAGPTQKPWGQTVAYVRDLNGFLVEICTAVAG